MRRQLGYWKKTQTSWALIGESVVRVRGFGFPQVLVPAPGVISGQVGVAGHGSAGGNLLPFPLLFVSPSIAGSAVGDHGVAEAAVFQVACRAI